MTAPSLTAEDEHLRDAVAHQLDRAAEAKGAIDVGVNDGVVTLTGVIDSRAGGHGTGGQAQAGIPASF